MSYLAAICCIINIITAETALKVTILRPKRTGGLAFCATISTKNPAPLPIKKIIAKLIILFLLGFVNGFRLDKHYGRRWDASSRVPKDYVAPSYITGL